MTKGKENYHFGFSKSFAALEDLKAGVEIHSAFETIRENIKISAKGNLCFYELKKHLPLFGEECSQLLEQRPQDKLQWL
jgi:hypothetical protein